MTEETWSEPLRVAGVVLRVKVRKVILTGRGRCSASLVPLVVEIGTGENGKGEVTQVALDRAAT